MAMNNKQDHIEKVIGVISDTHGLLRSEAVEALRGVDLILHAAMLATLKCWKR